MNVVLAVRNDSDHDDVALVSALSECFRATFRRQESLDIAFLDDASENEVRQVCRPLYARAA